VPGPLDDLPGRQAISTRLCVVKEGGLCHFARQGVALLIIPPLILPGVGAMTDFGPMIANPKILIPGAGSHLGIFVALNLAEMLGFTRNGAGAVGIIGGADGPMAIFVTVEPAKKAAGVLMNISMISSVAIRSTMAGDELLNLQTVMIVVLGAC
jgi:Na+-transporting methylmalonyl-CoA/oxaloacetate decarboxylase beta subunit